ERTTRSPVGWRRLGARAGRATVFVLALAVLAACNSTSEARPRASTTRRHESSGSTTPTTDAPSSTSSTELAAPGDPELAPVRGHTIVVDAGHAGGNATHTAEISRPVFIGTQSRACDTTGTQTASGYPE